MTAKWRTAFRAIAVTLIVFAVLTAIGWFGARYFTSSDDPHLYNADYYVAHFRADMLASVVIFGGMIIIHWLAAAIGGRADIRSRPADWLLGIAWLLILVVFAQTFFGFAPSWLAFVCPPPPQPYASEQELAPCSQARLIWAVILVFGPMLLLMLSALTRIVGSRRRLARG